MKNKSFDWKSAGRKLLWVFIGSAFIFSLAFTSHRQSIQNFTAINIIIDDSSGINFIDKADVAEIVQMKYGNILKQQKASINIGMLESMIEKNPYVANAEVFSTVDGKLVIDIAQRIPIVRVFNINNESFYIDGNGVYMPVSNKYTARVPVANGFITSKETDESLRVLSTAQLSDTTVKSTITEKIFAVCNYVRTHDFWNSQIEQVFVNAEGEIELVPRIGKHVIVFGDACNIDEKFENLMQVYINGFNKTGWNKYKTVNLKFKDRVICGY